MLLFDNAVSAAMSHRKHKYSLTIVSCKARRKTRQLFVRLIRPGADARLTVRVPSHLDLVESHHFAIVNEEFIAQWNAYAS
jgi:hypothetical protein